MKKIIALSSVVVGAVFLAGCGQQPVSQTQPTTPATAIQQSTKPDEQTQPVAKPETPAITKLISPDEIASWQTYTNAKYGFEFKYPKGWFLNNGRLSPQKIEDYEIGSDNAPIHFGVYTQNQDIFLNSPGGPAKPEILDFGNYNYQITNSKRNNPDSSVDINGVVFKRYDLADYGRYEGSSAGNIILLVGPKIKNQETFVVFEWEQFPGGKTLSSNKSQDYIDIASTLKFTK